MSRFDGKVALVSGASGGIGRATVKRLAGEGATVVGADVSGSDLRCDVTDPMSCTDAVAGVLDRHGRLDILANIAGVGGFKPTPQVTIDEWRRVLDVNLTGTFLMCQAAIDALRSTNGSIVNMASIAGVRAVPYNAAYCASKGGVVMLTKSLAIELAKDGVRVNAICPSAVDTPFLQNFQFTDEIDLSLFARGASALGRTMAPSEVAAAVAYLASDDAANITGVALVLDGGATA